jgi:hypothetical protein
MRARDRGTIGQVLSRSLFPAWAYRRNDMLIARLEDVRRLPRALPDILIRWGGPDDEADLTRIRPRHDGYGEHFRAGKRLLVGEVGGEVASFNWFDFDEVHDSPANGYRFELPPRSVWAFGFEVDPKFRMSGVFHKHWYEAMAMLGEMGVDRVYGSIQNDNPRSVNSHRRLGFEILYEFLLLRIGGVIRHRVLPFGEADLPSSSGFGRWEGTDPSRWDAERLELAETLDTTHGGVTS